ncbi:hypothetical protein FRC03_012159 [Tulasnella sp. 419]|nr:hypothetical protein FRC03_012159 [Tulasnella sp. 419]
MLLSLYIPVILASFAFVPALAAPVPAILKPSSGSLVLDKREATKLRIRPYVPILLIHAMNHHHQMEEETRHAQLPSHDDDVDVNKIINDLSKND